MDMIGKVVKFSKLLRIMKLQTIKIFRTCAEWVLRNGGCVKFQGYAKPLCDYNLLPPENTKFKVKEIAADNSGKIKIILTNSICLHFQTGNFSGLNAEGFDHIKGCEFLDSIILKNCSYIDDDALGKLVFRKDSLKHLEIDQCKSITEDGLKTLIALSNLKKLVIKDLPYVKNINVVGDQLKSSLKNCEIVIN
jgi:ATP synthase, H+ transporting, mitochondrial F0 complex, subunit s